MDEETTLTIIFEIMPHKYVKDMRDKLADGKFETDYHGFEQELFDQVSARKMDEESRKTGGAIGSVSKKQEPDDEYEEIEVWSDEWQRNVFGLARKRGRSRSRSRGREDDEEERPAKQKRRDQGDVKGGKGEGEPKGPCWTCGGAFAARLPARLRRRRIPYQHCVVIITPSRVSRPRRSPMEFLAS